MVCVFLMISPLFNSTWLLVLQETPSLVPTMKGHLWHSNPPALSTCALSHVWTFHFNWGRRADKFIILCDNYRDEYRGVWWRQFPCQMPISTAVVHHKCKIWTHQSGKVHCSWLWVLGLFCWCLRYSEEEMQWKTKMWEQHWHWDWEDQELPSWTSNVPGSGSHMHSRWVFPLQSHEFPYLHFDRTQSMLSHLPFLKSVDYSFYRPFSYSTVQPSQIKCTTSWWNCWELILFQRHFFDRIVEMYTD